MVHVHNGNVCWYSHYGDQYGVPEILKIKLPYDPAIPLVGIYLEKTIIQKDTCTPMFIAALFLIARTWKQPKCPSTEEQIKIHIYNGILLSHKNTICTNMDGPEIVILSEVKSERKRQIYNTAYMWNLKNRVQNELIYQTKIKLQM